ncbi:MAG TPA: hypothetical protein VFX89_04875 [Gammaproteobacteria bacterium]|nr:hypothetical protein [Gammaproteobacteria bacterium]
MPLDRDTIRFLECGELALYAACAGAALRPRVARVYGCRFTSGGSRAAVWVTRPAADRLLEALAATGRIAVVGSHIATLETFQLKASDARAIAGGPDDSEAVSAYREAFVRTGIAAGYREPLLRSVIDCDLGSIARIELTLAAAFMQTPGPAAGTPIAEAAR